MIVGYARLSTTDHTPHLQLDALKAARCKRIFTDQAGGRSMNRPELIRCLNSLRHNDTLVIWRLDRLGRSLKDLLETAERLRANGVQLLSLVEEIDTRLAAGEMVFRIFAMLAQFERSLSRERSIAGLATARARGRMGGGKMKTTPQQDKQLRALWDSGKFTGADIAQQFGISIPTFWRRVRATSLRERK